MTWHTKRYYRREEEFRRNLAIWWHERFLEVATKEQQYAAYRRYSGERDKL